MNKALKASSLLLVTLFCAVASTAQAPASPGDWDARAKAALSMSDGKLKIEELRQPVRVARDRWGVAHIYAQNQHDLFFAQGFV
ncbi:MAG TPA: penicillin acylase family protein, partial [Candidatus Angelobacter sp.]|nr:penicillin acylase family protein [Candidatus Angelobacter sp.]